MCGRYYLLSPADLLKERFSLPPRVPLFAPRYNMAPGQEAPVIVDEGKGRQLVTMRWGFGEGRIVNARAESAAQRGAFSDAFRHHRALIPADGFYEWRKTAGMRLPVAFRLRSREPFAFAGLVDGTSFTILTTDANDAVAEVHERMPVILSREDETAWLDPVVSSPEHLLPLLRPYPPEEVEGFDVSMTVNSVSNDGPACLEPRRERQAELFEVSG